MNSFIPPLLIVALVALALYGTTLIAWWAPLYLSALIVAIFGVMFLIRAIRSGGD